jgi:hypothetical protein
LKKEIKENKIEGNDERIEGKQRYGHQKERKKIKNERISMRKKITRKLGKGGTNKESQKEIRKKIQKEVKKRMTETKREMSTMYESKKARAER